MAREFISVRTNAKQIAARLGRLGREQMPFAASRAINDVLFAARKNLVENVYPDAFPNAPNKSFIRQSLRIKKSSKRNLRGVLFDRFRHEWLQRQALGGAKSPRRGRALAIPQYRSGAVRRTARGPRKNQTPRALLSDRAKAFSGRPRGFPGAPDGIWRRMGRGGRAGLRLMHVYKNRVRVAKGFPAYEETARLVDRKFARFMRRRLLQAIRTRR